MKLQLQKIKILLFLIIFIVSSFNVFDQNSSLISACSDFDVGTNVSCPFVLEALSKRGVFCMLLIVPFMV